jgi:hypothetical protein
MAKRRKGIAHPAYKHGQRAGYTEYRYGSPTPVTVAPIYRGESRKHVVSLAMDVMKDWRLSPFENEGAARAGLRSGLCEKGFDWTRSDSEAATIVAEALHFMGAKRPTWEQGQREYTESGDNCRRCGGAIPDDMLFGRKRSRYCSDVCARAAIQQSDFENIRRHDDVYRAAWHAIQRGSAPPRSCAHCGTTFRSKHPRARFCTPECHGLAKRTVPDRSCEHCGKRFRPKDRKVRFCSTQCGYSHRDEVQRSCRVCCKQFTAASPTALYCSVKCRNVVVMLRRGDLKRLSAPVFDYIMQMAA